MATKKENKVTDDLDDDHPLWLVNEQIKGLLEGEGATEDHDDVLTFLLATGLPDGTVKRMHRVIACGERLRTQLDAAQLLLQRIGRNPENVSHDSLLRDDLRAWLAKTPPNWIPGPDDVWAMANKQAAEEAAAKHNAAAREN